MVFGWETSGDEVVATYSESVKGKTFAITGASAGGLGAQTAIYLAAAKPAEIILLGRTESKSTSVITELNRIDPEIHTRFITLDLASFDSIRQAATELNASVTKLDILINNAGIMGLEKYTLTQNGLEAQFGANHIGHFLFTNLIMPKILAAGPGARVVNLASNGHWVGDWRGEDYNFHDGAAYDAWEAYGQSKTANILFAKSLAAKGVLAYSLHPGMIQTNLGNDVDPGVWPGVFAMFAAHGYPADEGNLTRFKTLPQGVATTLTAALSPEIVKDSGAYLVDSNVSSSLIARHATDMARAEALWKQSEEIVGERFEY
ncbi:hypothetical protein BP6252_12087 [Coleophoma cylindrospora]|uniref:Uncharacterized protein n=1 Tax=Coleophoma cylindrospora TaxID=1849047 RepID=A0A3D8QH07_9HELO|nr:hypothetical protein BP6252_12087 [Coleophoma cylindrospora]